MCNDCYDNDTQQANAQLIVTAVNSHEANVKRIEQLENALHQIAYASDPINELQKDSWINTARTISQEALSTNINPA